MSTLKTNNIQHVDLAEPSILLNSDGSVSIAGTVSYEDATNVDSVGVVTARKQLHVGTGVSIAAGGLNVTAGISTVQALQATTGTFSAAVSGTTGTFSGAVSGTTGTFTGDVSIPDKIVHTGDTHTAIRFTGNDTITLDTGGTSRVQITDATTDIGNDLSIADKIIHTGDTNTAIRFPSADTIQFETGGSERLKVDSTGDTIVSGTLFADSDLFVVDQIRHTGDTNTAIRFPSADTIQFETSGTQRLQIASTGNITLGTASAAGNKLYFQSSSGAAQYIASGGTNNQDLLIASSAGEKLRITSGGNVDINGTPPWSVTGGDYRNLSISGQIANSGGFLWLGNGAAATNADMDLARVNICNNSTIVAQIAGSTQTSANDDGRLTFLTKATGGTLTERVRIKSDGDFGVGLTNPTARLHAQDDRATATDNLKLRNYKSSVNTKPGLVFEASTTSGQGGNSYIRGLCGTDAGGSNSNNDSGMEFEVRQGGSGTSRIMLSMRTDGEIRQSGVYKQNGTDANNSGFTANCFYAKTFGPSSVGPGNSVTYNTTNGHATGLVHIFVNRNSNAAVNRGVGYGFHLKTTGQANLGSSIYDFTGSGGAPSFNFTQANQGVIFTNNASYTVTIRGRFELYGSVDG